MLFSDINFLGSREFYIAEQGLKDTMQFYHLNIYHARVPSTNYQVLAKFESFSQIQSNPEFKMECYQDLEDAAGKVGLAFNKYSWIYRGWLKNVNNQQSFTQTFIEMKQKHFHLKQNPDWRKIANKSESLDHFIAYIILSDSLYNISHPLKVDGKSKYIFFGKERTRYSSRNHQVILIGTQS